MVQKTRFTNNMPACLQGGLNVCKKKSKTSSRHFLLCFQSYVLFALFGLVLWPHGLFATNRLLFEPQIQSVTVYPDRALVFRSRLIELPKGRHRLVFRNASPDLENASLRAFAEHPSIIVQGIHSWLERQSHTIDPNIRKLEDELQKLERKEETLHLRQKRILTELAGIKDYEAYLKRSIGRDSKASIRKKSDWRKALLFLAERKESALERRESTQESIQEIKNKISTIKKKLAHLQSSGRKYRRIVEIHLQATKTIHSRIGFAYMMRKASWQVSYAMRYQKGRVEVDYFGNIRQRTGEDWRGVQIRLSTARPATGAARPTLGALSVWARSRRVKTQTLYIQSEEKAGAASDDEGPSASEKEESTGGYTDLDVQGNSVVFRIPGRADVPSSRRRFRLSIARYVLNPIAIEERIVPSNQGAAYSAVQLKNNRPFPMLAGTVDVYRSSGFVGRSSLSHTPSSGTFLLNLGSNQNIRVQRRGRRFQKRAGLLNSNTVFRRSVEIRVQNRASSTARLHVLERIPVSEAEEIKVRILSTSSAGYKERPRGSGILHWQFRLKAGEKRQIFLEYEVEAPTGFPKALLDKAN